MRAANLFYLRQIEVKSAVDPAQQLCAPDRVCVHFAAVSSVQISRASRLESPLRRVASDMYGQYKAVLTVQQALLASIPSATPASQKMTVTSRVLKRHSSLGRQARQAE